MLVDLNNDGKALEQRRSGIGTRRRRVVRMPRRARGSKHIVSDHSYRHGIGSGDVNGDRRNDILTPRGWLEAPADSVQGKLGPSTRPGTRSTRPGAVGSDGHRRPLTAARRRARPSSASCTCSTSTATAGTTSSPAPAHDYGVFWFEQGDNGTSTRRVIDNAWSQAHASTLVDLNGDGRKDLVTGKRFMAHNGSDPGENEPLGIYWYEFRPAAAPQRRPGVEWIRHVIDYGGRMGGGMQIPVVDIDRDGDLDLLCPGKSGLFLVENLTKSGKR